MRGIAEHWKDAGFFLYLGRHVGLPVCLEGALKLKEISYIPTDAYAAGEMKHGPIALLDEQTPVVCVATDSPVLDKVLSNIAEVRARGAHVIAVATEGNDRVDRARGGSRRVPRTRLAAAAAAGRDPAAAAGLPHRARARSERGPAAQPRQDGHGRVDVRRAWAASASTSSTSSASNARWSAGRGWRSGCSPTPSASTRPREARPGQHLAARFCAKEAVAKALDLRAWSFPRRRGGGDRRRARGAPERWRGRAGGGARGGAQVSLTHTDTTAGAAAIWRRAERR